MLGSHCNFAKGTSINQDQRPGRFIASPHGLMATTILMLADAGPGQAYFSQKVASFKEVHPIDGKRARSRRTGRLGTQELQTSCWQSESRFDLYSR
jgi:hypothetical protein